MIAEMATLEDRLRSTLARTRIASGLSLQDLSDRTSISRSTLSRLESGTRRLTVETLETLAEAFGTTAVALLAEAAQEDRLLLPTPTVELHGGSRGVILRVEDDGRQLLRLRVPNRQRFPKPESHPGTEWLHLLRGRLRLRVGARDVVLEPGQTAQFPTTDPHAMAGVDGDAEILSRFEPGAHRRPESDH